MWFLPPNPPVTIDVKFLQNSYLFVKKCPSPQLSPQTKPFFVKDRHSFFNIHLLLNILRNPTSAVTPEIVPSLKAEKAFDRVE